MTSKSKDELAERELAFRMRDELTPKDRTLLKTSESLIAEHGELFELLAEE